MIFTNLFNNHRHISVNLLKTLMNYNEIFLMNHSVH